MNTKIIKFDLNRYKLYDKIKAKQGDTKSRFLLFQLLDGAFAFPLENRSVRAYMIKPDGKEVFNDLIINNKNTGHCTLELTNQVLAVEGIVKIELMIIDGDKKLTSSIFELEVEKSINKENSIVSTNEFGALLNGLASLNEYDNYKNELKEARGGKSNLNKRLESFETLQTSITAEHCDGDVQKAVDLAKSLGVNKVTLLGKAYNLPDTLYLPSNFTLEGIKGETKLILKGVDKPVIDKKGSITGYTVIKNLGVVGDKTQPENTGIVLNDYYSTIENVTVIDCGKYGVHLSAKNATGTLVENTIKNVIVRRCVKDNFYADGGNKVTDGFLIDFISHGNGDNRALTIGSAAGWVVNGVHTYSHNTSRVVTILNAFNTNVDNIYIENFKGQGIYFGQVQQNLNANNLIFMTTDESANCIYVNKSTAMGYRANVNINNVSVAHSRECDINIVGGDGSAVVVNLNNVSITGSQQSRINLIASNIRSGVKTSANVNLDRELKDTDIALVYDNRKIKSYVTSKFSGNSEKTIKIPLPRLYGYEKIWIDIKMFAEKWDTGGNRLWYNASVYISVKTGSEVVAKRINNITPVGFTVEPTYLVDYENKTLNISFTPTESDGQGCLFAEIMI